VLFCQGAEVIRGGAGDGLGALGKAASALVIGEGLGQDHKVYLLARRLGNEGGKEFTFLPVGAARSRLEVNRGQTCLARGGGINGLNCDMAPTDTALIQPAQTELNLDLYRGRGRPEDLEDLHPAGTRHGTGGPGKLRLCLGFGTGVVRSKAWLIPVDLVAFGIQPGKPLHNVPWHIGNIDVPGFTYC
jgi:hypothetical protein